MQIENLSSTGTMWFRQPLPPSGEHKHCAEESTLIIFPGGLSDRQRPYHCCWIPQCAFMAPLAQVAGRKYPKGFQRSCVLLFFHRFFFTDLQLTLHRDVIKTWLQGERNEACRTYLMAFCWRMIRLELKCQSWSHNISQCTYIFQQLVCETELKIKNSPFKSESVLDFILYICVLSLNKQSGTVVHLQIPLINFIIYQHSVLLNKNRMTFTLGLLLMCTEHFQSFLEYSLFHTQNLKSRLTIILFLSSFASCCKKLKSIYSLI